ncbi:MAG TPA: FkbM family methyltransferase [Baekduia sp.]|nr:FkbM family methyltransferase [Baekduia sp.]
MLTRRQRALRILALCLKRFGLRERAVAMQLARRRRQRAREEARGSHGLSKPAAFELEVQLDAIVDRDRGYFIEAGANDGYQQSNTYWLEKFRGWRGLLVEPMPELAAEARRNRPVSTVVQCALVAPDHEGPVRMRFGDLTTSVVGSQPEDWIEGGLAFGWRDAYELDVPGRTLSDLLDEVGAPEVDLLSLDIEGYEAEALRGLDLQRHAPRYVLVEIHDRARNRPRIDALLGHAYVEHGWLSPIDLLYVRRDVAGVRSATSSALAPAGSD